MGACKAEHRNSKLLKCKNLLTLQKIEDIPTRT